MCVCFAHLGSCVEALYRARSKSRRADTIMEERQEGAGKEGAGLNHIRWENATQLEGGRGGGVNEGKRRKCARAITSRSREQAAPRPEKGGAKHRP